MQKSTINIVVLFAWILVLAYACTDNKEAELLEETLPEYELLFEYDSPLANLYMRRNLVDYFQQITLSSEYGANFPLTKKWTKPMAIFVSGNAEEALITELHSIIAELNGLFTDGFQIGITADSLAANYHVFLGDKASYAKQYPSIVHLLPNNRGLFTIDINSDFSIASGHMFVDIINNSLKHQKHILREELTQSLGLTNDIPYYPNSIFYEATSDVQVYSHLDIEVIRLLYHPRMIPKIGHSTVASILENILGI